MKRFFCFCQIIGCLVISANFCFGQVGDEQFKQNADTTKIFIIGNSFSQNATAYLPQLAKEGGIALKIGRAELPAASLKRHWDGVHAAENNSEKGKVYKGKSLQMLLEADDWHIVTVQQSSMFSGYEDSYWPYAQELCDFIKRVLPNCKILIHQTWAYRSDAKKFGLIGDKENAQNTESMWKSVENAYQSVSRKLNVELIPTGTAFWKASTAGGNMQYHEDSTFNDEQSPFPKLPNQDYSLHVGYYSDKQKKLKIDPNHANDAGKYLGSLVWYATIFSEDPTKLRFKPKKVDYTFAKFLREVARSVTE
ncbi:DUF4886 domain-containing protein [Olivibacter sp. SDN3]|uniref:DUF4886 domain-containing protein n=1 Tax=Olivibacter sp. SDN3 TaxID=2764720 RepID=UPI001650E639|nr:DUF4886 domain-containing protein [Olivibacter sp. SDN3]QNL52037.1 DUF4886 domain-containing protein [Olivibacter sp. SDN3]